LSSSIERIHCFYQDDAKRAGGERGGFDGKIKRRTDAIGDAITLRIGLMLRTERRVRNVSLEIIAPLSDDHVV
jgi:hypothetical protein